MAWCDIQTNSVVILADYRQGERPMNIILKVHNGHYKNKRYVIS